LDQAVPQGLKPEGKEGFIAALKALRHPKASTQKPAPKSQHPKASTQTGVFPLPLNRVYKDTQAF
jgi:hypothetical protein